MTSYRSSPPPARRSWRHDGGPEVASLAVGSRGAVEPYAVLADRLIATGVEVAVGTNHRAITRDPGR